MNKLKSLIIALTMIVCVSAVLIAKTDSFPPANLGSSDSEPSGSSSSDSDASNETDDD